MKKLFFIRHGESTANFKKLFAGQWDVELTGKGREEAKVAGQIAKDLNIDYIISSPLLRAEETARIIANIINYPADTIIFSKLFMERNYGDLQGQPYEAITGKNFEDIPDIEPESHLQTRAKQAAQYLKNVPADNILVVAHGTLGRALYQELLDIHSEEIEVPISQEIPNAEIVQWI